VQGRTLPQIMRAGRWRNLDSVALYLREAPIHIWATQADGAPPDENVEHADRPPVGKRQW
jgi:hypothetical protein